jgi:hypothetical protein
MLNFNPKPFRVTQHFEVSGNSNQFQLNLSNHSIINNKLDPFFDPISPLGKLNPKILRLYHLYCPKNPNTGSQNRRSTTRVTLGGATTRLPTQRGAKVARLAAGVAGTGAPAPGSQDGGAPGKSVAPWGRLVDDHFYHLVM